jgi:hypothetical protein
MSAEEHEVTAEIICKSLPGTECDGRSGVHLGIQKDEELFEASPANLKSIVFRPVLRARRNADGSANFLGPFAHGPKTERFIYLVWAVVRGKVAVERFGRIKVHLNHIKWTDVEKAVARKKPFKVTLELTKDNGKLVYASVRPGVAKWEL